MSKVLDNPDKMAEMRSGCPIDWDPADMPTSSEKRDEVLGVLQRWFKLGRRFNNNDPGSL